MSYWTIGSIKAEQINDPWDLLKEIDTLKRYAPWLTSFKCANGPRACRIEDDFKERMKAKTEAAIEHAQQKDEAFYVQLQSKMAKTVSLREETGVRSIVYRGQVGFYIISLEDKVEKMDNLLHKIPPPKADSKEELEAVQMPLGRFPLADIMPTLIDAYFMYLNNFLPVLHWPTFDKSLKEGLHYRKYQLGRVVLAVHALGSKYVYVPRVLIEGELSKSSSTSLRIFLGFLSIATILDIGGHWSTNRARCKGSPKEDNICLLGIDITLGWALGRACAICDEDIEIDVLTECDDEYWEHPDHKQPLGKPSTVSFLNFTSGTADYGMHAYYQMRKMLHEMG
ncbi:hypothetical protein EV421DRAFT_1741501 [Armillaria borealis]|uniref:Uncharacterized protein n=1 Tax=Armillaria borealis TaxID=47425 RepID=A0AA39J106_9AGAR|nr:hypothetical protein EV421DRAFT_1741501 [Armillaria borealis]